MKSPRIPIVLGCAFAAFLSPCCVAGLSGRIEQGEFPGPISGEIVRYTIYLPPGYDASSARYPVIYHLHGMGGTHDGPQIIVVPNSYEAARGAGMIGDAILVFPDGYDDSLWVDSSTSNKPAETTAIHELIPHVDSTYRTLACRSGRAVQGFSMGGFGAPMYGAKFPDLFCAVASYDGSLADWATVLRVRPDLAAELFANDESRFDQFSPWWWTTQNAPDLAQRGAFRLIVGGLQSSTSTNRAFRDHLLAAGITPDYVETGLPHDLPLLLQAQGAQTWAFLQNRFEHAPCQPEPCPGDTNGDSLVNFADLNTVLAQFGQTGVGLPGDTNADGVVNFADLNLVLANFGNSCE